jgi:hypothetical protein
MFFGVRLPFIALIHMDEVTKSQHSRSRGFFGGGVGVVRGRGWAGVFIAI